MFTQGLLNKEVTHISTKNSKIVEAWKIPKLKQHFFRSGSIFITRNTASRRAPSTQGLLNKVVTHISTNNSKIVGGMENTQIKAAFLFRSVPNFITCDTVCRTAPITQGLLHKVVTHISTKKFQNCLGMENTQIKAVYLFRSVPNFITCDTVCRKAPFTQGLLNKVVTHISTKNSKIVGV